MNSPLLRTAGSGISAGFASSALRRACLIHRANRLTSCAVASKRKPVKQHTHPYATEARRPVPHHGSHASTQDRRPSEASAVQQYGGKSEPDLTRYLDPYLPLRLRSGSWIDKLADFEGIRSPQSLAATLLGINDHFPAGALTHIALDQYRWSAFVYLAEALVKSAIPADNDIATIIQDSPWGTIDINFPYIGLQDGHVKFSPSESSRRNEEFSMLDAENGSTGAIAAKTLAQTGPLDCIIEPDSNSVSARKEAMGHLWQALGLIAIKSASHGEEYSDYMMSHVHRVLATIHHGDKMHPSVYDFDTQATPEAVRKSPFLHTMRARFTSVIADAAWKVQERDIIEHYDLLVAADKKGDGPKFWDPAYDPRFIEPEAWIELILWSCVHEGHIDSAMAILQEITKDADGQAWSTVAWSDVLGKTLGDDSAAARKKLRERFDRVMEEGYAFVPPLFDHPTRTISCEVVAAVIDSVASARAKPLATVNQIRRLRRMFADVSSDSAQLFWNRILIQLLDFTDLPSGGRPSYTEAVAGILRETGTRTTVVDENRVDDASGSPLGLGAPIEVVHSRAVAGYLSLGDLAGALRSYGKVFFGRQSSDTTVASACTNLTLPSTTIGSFIEACIKNNKLNFGKWMVYSTDAGGPLVSEQDFASPAVQPALIRLGIALGDNVLIARVAERVRTNSGEVSPAILRSLLDAQIALRNFVSAESILSLMRERKIAISDGDVLGITSAIVEMDSNSDSSTGPRDTNITQACKLLENILSRRFSPPVQIYTQPDHDLHRRMNQLSKMIASVGGRLYSVAMQVVPASSGGNTISADNFNVLLEAVVNAQGAIAGKALYDQWCISPTTTLDSDLQHSRDPNLPLVGWDNDENAACVTPTPRTVRILMQPIIDALCQTVSSRGKQPSGPAHTDVTTSRGRYPLPDQETLEAMLDTGETEVHGEKKIRALEVHLTLKADLPLSLLDRSMLEWAMSALQELGWTTEEVVAEYPDIYEVREEMVEYTAFEVDESDRTDQRS